MRWNAQALLLGALIAATLINGGGSMDPVAQVDAPSRTSAVVKRRYCAAPPMVGAWVANRPCRTPAEWRRDAIDLLGPR